MNEVAGGGKEGTKNIESVISEDCSFKARNYETFITLPSPGIHSFCSFVPAQCLRTKQWRHQVVQRIAQESITHVI